MQDNGNQVYIIEVGNMKLKNPTSVTCINKGLFFRILHFPEKLFVKSKLEENWLTINSKNG